MENNNLSEFYSYPGYIKETIRNIKQYIKKIDLLIEVCDARIPLSSRIVSENINKKDSIIIFSKSDLADPHWNQNWQNYYFSQKQECLFINLKQKKLHKLLFKIKAYQLKLEKYYQKKSITSPPIRILVIGLPNTGKSTLINSLVRKKTAKTGANPGITRHSNWIKFNSKMEILDNPGILPAVLQTEIEIHKLYATFALKKNATLDYLSLKYLFQEILDFKKLFLNYYNLDTKLAQYWEDALQQIKKKCFFVNDSAACQAIFTDFRIGKMGRITLDQAIPE